MSARKRLPTHCCPECGITTTPQNAGLSHCLRCLADRGRRVRFQPIEAVGDSNKRQWRATHYCPSCDRGYCIHPLDFSGAEGYCFNCDRILARIEEEDQVMTPASKSDPTRCACAEPTDMAPAAVNYQLMPDRRSSTTYLRQHPADVLETLLITQEVVGIVRHDDDAIGGDGTRNLVAVLMPADTWRRLLEARQGVKELRQFADKILESTCQPSGR